MSFHTLLLQLAFMWAPFCRCPIEQVTPTLYRGPDPRVSDIYRLHDQGIKTIISLRTNSQHKKQQLCSKLGINWVNIKTGVFKTPTPEQFDRFRTVVNSVANQPCYMACEVDMDRTSVYIAAHRLMDQNWSQEKAMQEINQHHPKKWWPAFRKYKNVLAVYGEQRAEKLVQQSPPEEHELVQTTAASSPAIETE